MIDISEYLSPKAVEKMRQSIADANGNEVFFVGHTDENKIVTSVQVVARGNEFSVLHIQEMSERSDVAIHNHPSGELTPSTNDMAIAQELSNDGIASYIVNNEVTALYPIIEPFDKNREQALDIPQIIHLLEPEGSVSKKMPQYEHRPQQLEMIRAVCQAFNEKKIAVIEAGTGVGKSMAYLIPAIFWASYNKQRCVVSTRTINLQEQLIYKDIPFLKKALNQKFDAVLVKGRGNYICLRKLETLKKEMDFLVEDEFQSEIDFLLNWAAKTEDGSKSDLNFVPRNEVWDHVAAEADNCLRSKCVYFSQCFVMKARRRANEADILVVNHHLLFSDLSLRAMGVKNSVLPRYDNLIFDETHNIEDIATDYFGAQVTRYGITRALYRLYNPAGKKSKGFIPVLVSRLKSASFSLPENQINRVIKKITKEIYPLCDTALTYTNELMDTIAAFVQENDTSQWNELKVRLSETVQKSEKWQQLLSKVENYSSFLKRLVSSLQTIQREILDAVEVLTKELDIGILDVRTQQNRLSNALEIMQAVFFENDEEHVRWIEVAKRKRRRDIVRIHISPLDISEHMESLVFNKLQTVIMTSATLAIADKSGNDFTFFNKQVGLNRIPAKRTILKQIPAPFDYYKQAITAIPTDLPFPDSAGFGDLISDFIYQALKISNGSAFILFTSYGLLNKVFSNLHEKLSQKGITPLKQGEMARNMLLNEFRKDKNSVLFATDSFWQGVDVEGEALENVIITKLPFKVPSEPYVEAKMEYIKRHGGNAFMDYSLPHAILKLKQGFGRLIRKKTDIGSVFILDKRLLEKFYGKFFLKSLPETRIVKGPSEVILLEVKNFFDKAHKKVSSHS